ncbi:MAG: hypothetical protein IKE66_13060 [Hyphomicrobium sp.]|nr:hypothetical protein [Hyphomicrobium sp.]
MFDILLDGITQKVVRRRWWLAAIAVLSGAVAALLFVGLLGYAGLLPA